MIDVSREFLAEVAGDNRNFLYYMDFVLDDGTILHLTNADLWQGGLTIEVAVSTEESIDVGSTIINQCTIILDNINEQFDAYDFAGAKVTVSIGLEIPGENNTSNIERFQKGIFTVDSVMYDSSLVTLTCLDNMVRFDQPIDKSLLTFPTNLRSLVNRVCQIRSVTDGIDYDTLPMWNMTIAALDNGTDTLTYRDVIAWAAQVNGMNARINRMGELKFMWYDRSTLEVDDSLIGTEIDPEYLLTDHSGEDEEVVMTQDYVGLLLNYPIFNLLHGIYSINAAKIDTVITGVKVVVRNDIADQNALDERVRGTDEYMIVIENNGLVNADNADAVADAVAAQVIGMRFRKANYMHIGYPTMEAGDIAFIYDGKNRLYRTLVSGTTFTSGDQQNTYSAGQTPSVNAISRYSESTKNFVKTKQLTDKTFNSLQERIVNSSGLYTTEESDGQGGTIYYMHDRPQLSQSMIIWKMTAEAWGVSTDGGETYKYGMTVDGDTIVRILSAEGISADWIESGELRSRNGRSLYDLNSGRFFLTGSSGLNRVVFRGNSASIILQRRSSTEEDWDDPDTFENYIVGTIYFGSGGNSNCTFNRFNIGNYADTRTIAYISNGSSLGFFDHLTVHNTLYIKDPNVSTPAFYVLQNSTDRTVPIVTVYGESLYGSWEGITLASGFTQSAGAENVAHYNKVNGEATLNFFVQGTLAAATETVIGTLAQAIPRGTVTGACCVAVNGNPQFARVTVNTSGEISIWSPVAAAAPHGSISYRILDVTGA